MPSAERNRMNRSNRDAGSTRSATVVNGSPFAASHAPACSQFPMCGSAAMVPRPDASAARSRGSATMRMPLMIRSRGMSCSRKTSSQ